MLNVPCHNNRVSSRAKIYTKMIFYSNTSFLALFFYKLTFATWALPLFRSATCCFLALSASPFVLVGDARGGGIEFGNSGGTIYR